MRKQSFWDRKRVLLTGASGFVGRNLIPLLESKGCILLIPTRTDYDLLEQRQVRQLLHDTQPDIVFHLAALSGGIMANKQYPADFCYQNLVMNTVMLHEAWKVGVKKYITLIGGCSYPANASSPITEDQLWNGYPQAESAPYSIAKKMNVTMAEAYRRQHGFDAIVLIPGNLYGPHDNFDLQNSHVIPALIRKFFTTQIDGLKEVVVWGTGAPVRDFIYIEDACEAIVLAAENHNTADTINISSGTRTTIRELAETIADVVGYEGHIQWDTSKPDGQMYKGFDVTRMHKQLGYHCHTSLREGLQKTFDWFTTHQGIVRLSVPIQSAL